MQLTTSRACSAVALHDRLHQLGGRGEDLARRRCRSTLIAPRRANSRMAAILSRAPARRRAELGASESRRCAPGASPPSAQRAEARPRCSSSTGWPTASHMRRTWRLRPSRIVSSSSSAPSARTCGRARSARPRAPPPRAARASACSATAPPPTRHAVGLRHLVARVGEPVGELAVVGQQDQPAAVGVEAPDRVEAQAAGAGPASTTVGRPCVSRAVETTPSGLLSA